MSGFLAIRKLENLHTSTLCANRVPDSEVIQIRNVVLRLAAHQSAKFSDQHESRLSLTRSVSVVCPIAGPSRKARSVYS